MTEPDEEKIDRFPWRPLGAEWTEPDEEKIDRFTLHIDSDRWAERLSLAPTGIFVRARLVSGGWESADIAYLDAASLLIWLHGRGGCNPWAENVVGILLGHGHIHED